MSKHVAIVGLGATGSALCDLLARDLRITKLTLIDPGFYGPENLNSQRITQEDIDLPKVVVQRRRAELIRSDIEIVTYLNEVGDLPPGILAADVIAACVDSLEARMDINLAAWRLGIPWVDSGVLASQMLARIEMFYPAEDAPCLECTFTDAHYQNMKIRAACQKPGDSITAPTNSPVFLSGVASALQAAEISHLLNGDDRGLKPGVQLLYGLDSRQIVLSRNRRNPECRFDHVVYRPAPTDPAASVGQITERFGLNTSIAVLRAPGYCFAERLVCARCGEPSGGATAIRTAATPTLRCKGCGKYQTVHPWILHESLCLRSQPADTLRGSIVDLGMRPGDIFSLDANGTRIYCVAMQPGSN